MSHWYQGLNSEQAKAVAHNYGPLLILAGAGSGKTTVLVARTGRLIEERIAPAKNICVLTFTNKAAREMKHRVTAKLGSSAKGIWAGTFHSFGLQLLRRYHRQAKLSKQFGVIDSGDAQSIIKDLVKEVKNPLKDKFDSEKVLSLINDLRSLGKFSYPIDDEYAAAAEVLLPKYVKRLELLGVVDFEGLLLKPMELFKSHPEILEELQESIHQLMVDEFQDTNSLQMSLINALVKKHRNITVVGDDDQSIYGWRGADVNNILDFPRLYKPCEVIKLENNYRSTPSILDVANSVIQKNVKRHGKLLKSDRLDRGAKPEVFVYETEDEESENIVEHITHFYKQGYKYKDIAILYRSNSQGGFVEAQLRRAQVPYSLSGGTAFFDRREIKDILAYMRSSLAPHEVAMRRIINSPSRGIGEVTVQKIADYSENHKVSFYQAVQNWREADIPEKTGENIDALRTFLEELPNKLVQGNPGESAGETLLRVFTEIGYRQFVYASVTEPQAAEKKWMFVEIFSRVLDSFVMKGGRTLDTIKEFIDCMELRDQLDDSPDGKEVDQVQLLTLHACKGLEYPVCLLIGVEEDIIPHRTLGSDIDEERRLFYVGVTRAKSHLVLTRARMRKRYGSLKPSSPSRFLVEIPDELVEVHESGFRPVSGDQRESLVASFLKQLDQKIEKRDKIPSSGE